MSKSNYEEVLENELNYEEVLYCTNHFIEDIKEDTKLFIHHTRKALERAQKQEKLLELYIDLGNTIEVLDNAYGYGIFEFSEIKYITNKIKGLENENN